MVDLSEGPRGYVGRNEGMRVGGTKLGNERVRRVKGGEEGAVRTARDRESRRGVMRGGGGGDLS